MPKIFISYRRADSQSSTDHIYDRLVTAFGENNVFLDVDSIPAGADFRSVLRDSVDACDVVLVIIGSQWAVVTDEKGHKRLFDSADFVRIEVENALNRQKYVIPVLIDGAVMPSAEDLPPLLDELRFRNAAKIRHYPDFNRDILRLVKQIKLHEAKLVGQRIEIEAKLMAKAKADAEETERQHQTDLVNRLKAQETEREHKRLADEQATYEEKPRQQLNELEAVKREQKLTRQPIASLSKSATTEPYKLSPLPESEMGNLQDDKSVSTKPLWWRFQTPYTILILLIVIIVITFAMSELLQQKRLGSFSTITPTSTSIFYSVDWKPVEKDYSGVIMVQIPAGCFDMGNDSQAYDGGTQGVGAGGHICFENTFWLDKTEVTNAQFAKFGGKADKPSNWTGGNRPRETITWLEARNFCILRGARLPTEAEWEYAARGTDNLVYPWGNKFVGDNVVYSENSNNETANVGSKYKGASWAGALDMSGNVWEWVSTLYQAYPYPIPGSDYESQKWININSMVLTRSMRGGSWGSTELSGLRTTYRYWFNTYGSANFVGFRCMVSSL